MSDVTVITASDILNQANRGHVPFTDAEIATHCKTCEQLVVQLGQCEITQTEKTVYKCPRCKSILAQIVKPEPSETANPDGAYRLGDFVLRHAAGLFVRNMYFPTSAEVAEEKAAQKAALNRT